MKDEWYFMKNYNKNLGMSLFCSTFLTYVCVLLGLRVISLRLIFQYDVRGTLSLWGNFFDTIRGPFWRNDGVSSFKWSTSGTLHIGQAKSFLGSFPSSEFEDNLTLELIFSRTMRSDPECFHFTLKWAITLKIKSIILDFTEFEKLYILQTASAALI